MSTESLIIIGVVLLSLCVGSFLNVLIYRLPIMLNHYWKRECEAFMQFETPGPQTSPFNLFWPRSRCQNCQTQLKAWHNIPILSYLLLKGYCGFCQARISARYPLIELSTLLLSLAVMAYFGLDAKAYLGLIYTWFLIAIFMIDLDNMIIPDSLSLGLLWIGLLSAALGYTLAPTDAIMGATIGYGSLWSFTYLFKFFTGKMGMGHGDFKLFAAMGAWVGASMLLFIILIASILGSIIGISLILFFGHAREKPIPFGPFLVIGGWLAYVGGPLLVYHFFN